MDDMKTPAIKKGERRKYIIPELVKYGSVESRTGQSPSNTQTHDPNDCPLDFECTLETNLFECDEIA